MAELPAARKRRTPTREVERSLWKAGHAVVAGVDETGWGALAGTVSVGAAVVPKDLPIPDRLRDSKALNLNPPIHVPKTNPDQGDLRDRSVTGSCSSSQDRTILTNSYRRRSGGISTISPCPMRPPHRWIQAKEGEAARSRLRVGEGMVHALGGRPCHPRGV